MSTAALLIGLHPNRKQWQLGTLSDGVLLIGWTGFSGIDAGVPDRIAKVLATALAEEDRVSFLASSDKTRIVRGRDRPEWRAGVSGWWRRPFDSAPPVIATTRDLGAIAGAFDDPAAPWWLQGQVMFGTAPGAPALEVAGEALAALMSDDWCRTAAAFPGLRWCLRPGVDGDMAGLCPRDRTIGSRLSGALAEAAATFSIEFEVITEDAFSERLRG